MIEHMDVLGLLRSKNRCLEKFLEASTEFLSRAQSSEDLPDLLEFESRRDSILKAIELYDRKINEAVALLPPGQKPDSLIEAVKAALSKKDWLVHQILLVDDQILQRIEREKAKTLKQMVTASKQANTVQKFKSSWVPESGEGLDEQL